MFAERCPTWFLVANVAGALHNFKPQGRRDAATFEVTVHNFACFVHVARALEKVLPSDAVVWLAAADEVCVTTSTSAKPFSPPEADLEKIAWTAAMDRFAVAGESPRLNRLHVLTLNPNSTGRKPYI